LGTLLESIAMLVLTISEVVPIAMGLNWDLIWFGIIVVVVLETGMIRPPLVNLFIVESIALGFRWVRFFAGFARFGFRWH
jgi:TRAP-type C4-dicarboxylate transport system permease large subunit